jgi:hypothetical protein
MDTSVLTVIFLIAMCEKIGLKLFHTHLVVTRLNYGQSVLMVDNCIHWLLNLLGINTLRT